MFLDLASVPAKWHQNPFDDLSRGARIESDRQPDRQIVLRRNVEK